MYLTVSRTLKCFNSLYWLVDRPARMDTLRLLIGLMPRVIFETRSALAANIGLKSLLTLAAIPDLAAKVGRQDLEYANCRHITRAF